MGDGYQDFFPPPTETRQLIGADYAVPATLLVQFTNDNTDETPEVEAILRADWSAGSPASSRGGGGASAAGAPRAIERQLLPGSHVTPCGGDAGWRLAPGQPFTPVDAVALAAKAVLQADNRRLADRVLAWLDAHS